MRVTLSAFSIRINIKLNGKMGADATTDNCVRISGAFNCELLMIKLPRPYSIQVHFIIIHMYRMLVVFANNNFNACILFSLMIMLRLSTQWVLLLRVENGKRFFLFGHIKIAVDLREKSLWNNGHHPSNQHKNHFQIVIKSDIAMSSEFTCMQCATTLTHAHSAHHYEFLWHKPLAYIFYNSKAHRTPAKLHILLFISLILNKIQHKIDVETFFMSLFYLRLMETQRNAFIQICSGIFSISNVNSRLLSIQK